jgi:hypothetical protein
MEPFLSGPFVARVTQSVARAASPPGIARGLKWLGDWLVKMLKTTAEGVLKFLWNTFWTGSIVGLIVVTVLIVIVAELAIGGLGLSSADRASAMQSIGAVLVVAWLLRLLLFMVMGDRSKS